jgi:hypothetical protein
LFSLDPTSSVNIEQTLTKKTHFMTGGKVPEFFRPLLEQLIQLQIYKANEIPFQISVNYYDEPEFFIVVSG